MLIKHRSISPLLEPFSEINPQKIPDKRVSKKKCTKSTICPCLTCFRYAFLDFFMLHHDVRDILFLIKLSVLIQFLKLFSNCLSNSNRIRNCGFRSARLDYESTDDSALLDSFNGPSVWQLYCERCELRLPRIRSKSIFSRFSIILSTYAPSESRRTTADLQDFPLS